MNPSLSASPREIRLDLRTSSARTRWLGGIALALLAASSIVFAREGDQLAMIAFGVCLGAVALYVVGGRHQLVVDPGSARITRVRGLFVTFPVATYVATEIAGVALSEYMKRSGRNRRTERYRVTAAGGRRHVLADLGDPWHARYVAERLCIALNIPFDNTVYGASSVRNASELDVPLTERWRSTGIKHERPAPSADTAIRVENHGADSVLSIPAETYALKFIALMTGGIAGLAVPFYRQMDSLGGPVFFYGFFGAFGVLILYAVLQYSGRSKIVFTNDRVAVRLGWTGFSSMSIAEIEELIPGDGINFVSDKSALWVPWPKSRADRDFLLGFIAYELAKRGSAARSSQPNPSG